MCFSLEKTTITIISQFNVNSNGLTWYQMENIIYLTIYVTHFTLSYIGSDICYYFLLAARVSLYVPSHRQRTTTFVALTL